MIRVLFICTGNTCRSPMAEAIYGKISKEYGINSAFSSAGLGFCQNDTVSPNAVEVCKEIGLDISSHRARPLRQHDIDITDIFVVMTKSHAEDLIYIGVAQNKIYILNGGIPDPYGSDLETYRKCRNLIKEGIYKFCDILKKYIDKGLIK